MIKQKRILTIQDISCVGRCSITVAQPILSACGHETSILPTAILSTHTGGFGRPAVVDLTAFCRDTIQHWIDEKITFDCILTGYLGSAQAVRLVTEKARVLLKTNGKLIVDPAMADNGKLYSGLDEEYVQSMTELCKIADIILPNCTELGIIIGNDYGVAGGLSAAKLLAEEAAIPNLIITGITEENQIHIVLRCERNVETISHPLIPGHYHGTGDIFAACFAGMYMNNESFRESACSAAEFTLNCIFATDRNAEPRDGVSFERALPLLIEMLKAK